MALEEFSTQMNTGRFASWKLGRGAEVVPARVSSKLLSPIPRPCYCGAGLWEVWALHHVHFQSGIRAAFFNPPLNLESTFEDPLLVFVFTLDSRLTRLVVTLHMQWFFRWPQYAGGSSSPRSLNSWTLWVWLICLIFSHDSSSNEWQSEGLTLFESLQ